MIGTVKWFDPVYEQAYITFTDLDGEWLGSRWILRRYDTLDTLPEFKRKYAEGEPYICEPEPKGFMLCSFSAEMAQMPPWPPVFLAEIQKLAQADLARIRKGIQ